MYDGGFVPWWDTITSMWLGLCHIQMMSIDFQGPWYEDSHPSQGTWAGIESSLTRSSRERSEDPSRPNLLCSQPQWKQQWIRRGEGHLCTMLGGELWPVDISMLAHVKSYCVAVRLCLLETNCFPCFKLARSIQPRRIPWSHVSVFQYHVDWEGIS